MESSIIGATHLVGSNATAINDASTNDITQAGVTSNGVISDKSAVNGAAPPSVATNGPSNDTVGIATNGVTNGPINAALRDFSRGSWKPEGMQAYAAPSLFQPHNARQAIRDAHERKIPVMLGVYYGISSIPAARFLAPVGFDAVWIDWEHTSCNVETMTTMVHETMFMSGGRTIPFVRVPGHDHAAIGFALDCGASIVIPQVDTVEQCKHVLSAAKYGSKQGGSRSAPPFRLIPGLTDMPMFGDDLHKSVNNQAAVMIQIETLEGINNLDDILTACPEIDMVWLGHLDARISMNLRAKVGMSVASEPEWLEAETTFLATMKKHNKPRAGFAFGDEALKKALETYSLIIYDADVRRLASMVDNLRSAKKTAEAIAAAAI